MPAQHIAPGPGLLSQPSALESLLDTSALLEEMLRSDPSLKPAHQSLTEGTLGSERLRLHAVAFRGSSLRWARHVELTGDQGTLALNTCLFPDPGAAVPVWSFEILALRGRLHLLALDALPTAPHLDLPCRELLLEARARLDVAPDHACELAPWYRTIASPWALLLRPPGPLPPAALVPSAASRALASALALAERPAASADPTAQRVFIDAMSEHDPAVAYLGRAFGHAWARRFCEQTLFPPC